MISTKILLFPWYFDPTIFLVFTNSSVQSPCRFGRTPGRWPYIPWPFPAAGSCHWPTRGFPKQKRAYSNHPHVSGAILWVSEICCWSKKWECFMKMRHDCLFIQIGGKLMQRTVNEITTEWVFWYGIPSSLSRQSHKVAVYPITSRKDTNA